MFYIVREARQRAERVARRVSSREAARSVGREAAHIGPRSDPQGRAGRAKRASQFLLL